MLGQRLNLPGVAGIALKCALPPVVSDLLNFGAIDRLDLEADCVALVIEHEVALFLPVVAAWPADVGQIRVIEAKLPAFVFCMEARNWGIHMWIFSNEGLEVFFAKFPATNCL